MYDIDSIICTIDMIDAERDLLESARQASQAGKQHAPGQGREGVPGSKVILNCVANGSHL